MPKMAQTAGRSRRVPARPRAAAPSRSRSATTPSSRPSRATISGFPNWPPWDLAFAIGAAEGEPVRVLRTGSAPVFSRRPGARGPLPRRRDDLRRAHPRSAARRHGIRSVRFFDIPDGRGALVGQFYFDLYAREGKQGGAWMDDAINRRRMRDVGAASGRVPDLQPVARRSAASPRRSRTTKSSRSSTSSGTACTSC